MTSALFTQPALGFSSSQAASSRDDRELTHAPSTDSMTSSFDSYESTRDISRFIREIGGRCMSLTSLRARASIKKSAQGIMRKMKLTFCLQMGLNGEDCKSVFGIFFDTNENQG